MISIDLYSPENNSQYSDYLPDTNQQTKNNTLQLYINEVFEYLDRVRDRAGLDGVQESWANFSSNPNKPNSKEGLRAIIHQERNIEMAFEGSRFWDIRRWKEASREFNEPIRGWNVFGEDEASYYQVRTVFQQRFVSPRDYFWPLAENTLLQNSNLVQNLGW